MPEILLAPHRDDIPVASHLLDRYSDVIMGAKLLLNDVYEMHDGSNGNVRNGRPTKKIARHDVISRVLRFHGAQNIMLDMRLVNDTKEEASEIIRSIFPNGSDSAPTTNYVSLDSNIPLSTLTTFVDTIHAKRITPVLFATSSRKVADDYTLRRTSPRNDIEIALEIAERANIGHFICAAADVSIIKELHPRIYTFATGAFHPGEPLALRHPRGAPITACLTSDVIVIGSPILKAQEPYDALETRLDLLAAGT